MKKILGKQYVFFKSNREKATKRMQKLNNGTRSTPNKPKISIKN